METVAELSSEHPSHSAWSEVTATSTADLAEGAEHLVRVTTREGVEADIPAAEVQTVSVAEEEAPLIPEITNSTSKALEIQTARLEFLEAKGQALDRLNTRS